MRETIVKDGIQVRLQDLLGSEYNDSSSFSIQSSMLEDMNRICRAIVGDNPSGKVMAGMTINTDGTVNQGYAITYSGKVIKFGSSRGGNPPITPNSRVNVYAQYIQETRSAGTSGNGGWAVPVIRSGQDALIIKDQIGSSSNSSDNAGCVSYNTGAISIPTDAVYVGSLVYGADVSSVSVVYPQAAKGDVAYTYSLSARDVTIWTNSGTDASCFNTTHASASKVLVDMGRNNLKKIRVVLKNKSTSTAPRAGNDSDLYKIRFASARFNSIGGSPGTGGTLYAINQLTEATSVDFDVNEYIDPSVGYVGVQFYMSASTTSDRFATDATTGIADIQYIIEKLN